MIAFLLWIALGLLTSALLIIAVAFVGVSDRSTTPIAYIRRRRLLPTSTAIEPASKSNVAGSSPAPILPLTRTAARPGSSQPTSPLTSCPRPSRSRRAGP